jgi:hypothetical protein
MAWKLVYQNVNIWIEHIHILLQDLHMKCWCDQLAVALPFLTCTTTKYICTSEKNNYNDNLDSCSLITIIGSIVLDWLRVKNNNSYQLNQKISFICHLECLNEGIKWQLHQPTENIRESELGRLTEMQLLNRAELYLFLQVSIRICQVYNHILRGCRYIGVSGASR